MLVGKEALKAPQQRDKAAAGRVTLMTTADSQTNESDEKTRRQRMAMKHLDQKISRFFHS